MSYSLYSVLPTEIVWKIYDDLHKSYMKDLNTEISNFISLEDYRIKIFRNEKSNYTTWDTYEEEFEYIYFGNCGNEEQPNDWDYNEDYIFNTCDIVDDNHVELDFI